MASGGRCTYAVRPLAGRAGRAVRALEVAVSRKRQFGSGGPDSKHWTNTCAQPQAGGPGFSTLYPALRHWPR